MRAKKRRRPSSFNPFISLTDILFNLVLVLIFASAIFAQDINRKYAENKAFQERLAAMQLERDALIKNVESLGTQLDAAEVMQDTLRANNLSLEEQIAVLVSNLDGAQTRQEQLAQQISVILGNLDESKLANEALQTKLTVILGDLDTALIEKKVLEEEVTLVLGNLSESQALTNRLRTQVSALSRQNFLVIELEWLTESHDLDLHVVDPDGNRFYWNQPSYPGLSSRLTLDNRIGARPNKPGLEIWTARELKPGRYRIEVGLWGCDRAGATTYRPCQTDAIASILVRHRDGDDLIPEVKIPAIQTYAQVNGQDLRLNETLFDRLVLVAEIEVSEVDGEVRVQVVPSEGLSVERVSNTAETSGGQ